MKPVNVITGKGVPLERSDVDTDQIIPSDWLKRVERTGFGAGLFSEWRDDRDFVLNRPEHQGAVVLVAGPNFGTGSSREHAVWALMDYGFEVVISSRFADIFRNNCTKQGLLPVVLPEETVQQIQAGLTTSPEAEVTVDLTRQQVEVPALGIAASFEIDPFTRERLLNGWDDIGLTLRHEGDIDSFEAARPAYLPTSR